MSTQAIKLSILNKVKKYLLRVKKEIAFCGYFGDLVEDIDLLIILNGRNNDPIGFTPLKKVLTIFNVITKHFAREGIKIKMFPTFRLQTFVDFLSRTPERHQNKKILLHLLIYPSIPNFILWEEPLIILAISKRICPLIGQKDIWQAVLKKVTLPNHKTRIALFHKLFYETYILHKTSLLPDAIKGEESLHKIKYIVKNIYADMVARRRIPKKNKLLIRHQNKILHLLEKKSGDINKLFDEEATLLKITTSIFKGN